MLKAFMAEIHHGGRGVPSNSLSQECGERAFRTMEVVVEREASNRLARPLQVLWQEMVRPCRSQG